MKLPTGEQFSTLFLLGSNHMNEDYPFNIQAGSTYTVYLGVGNEMGSPEYYMCCIKLGNESGPFPDSTRETASSLSTLFQYNSFVENGATWEAPLTFTVENLTFTNDACQLSGIIINGMDYPINIESIWDSNSTGYYFTLIAELWMYNSATGAIQYDNRYVSLFLNMTQ